MSNALVIIPTFDEKDNIELIIHAIFSLPKDFHVLIVDDNSPDGTSTIVESLLSIYNEKEQRLHHIKRDRKRGLGTAYITGFYYALEKKYEYILEMDADFSHDPNDLIKLYLACAENNVDVAIGSRYCSGVNVVNWPMGRVLMSYFASMYVRLITSMSIHDTTAGFICYRAAVLQTIKLNKVKFEGYAFQIEMKFLAWKYGFRITELPIIFTDRVRGYSKMSTGIFSEAFLGVIKMTVKSWFKKYIPQAA